MKKKQKTKRQHVERNLVEVVIAPPLKTAQTVLLEFKIFES